MAQRRGKVASKPNKPSKAIEQYCSVCKKSFDMPIVEEAETNDVIWLKCPGCQGYLPFMTEKAHDGLVAEGETNHEEEGFQDLALEDIDIEKAREYIESDSYNVGDIIYHRSWNDYGKVVAKEILPGHRKTILVQFVSQGKIRLLEGVA
ncbi:MAG: hypothetical protein JSV33_10240 [bacterium]|nr:MAG: hypothetical protein JSV33_10240 [bacterium]